MRETSNYKLNQWDKTDRIKMEDFNSDNQKIDSQLHAAMQQLAQAASQEGLAAEQAAREAAVSAEAAARESADTARAAALRNELAAEKQARENADAAQAETLRSENMWVKLGEATLSAAAETLSVTVSNPEKYRQMQIAFTTGGCSYLYVTINGSNVAEVLDFSTACSGAIGFATLVIGTQAGYHMDCSVGARNGTNNYKRTGTAMSTTYLLSGSATLGLSANGGTLNTGSHIDIYGLKK